MAAKLYSLVLSHPSQAARLKLEHFQIGTTVRVLLAYEDLHRLVEGRPAGDLAMRLLPRYPGPIPPFLPREWLAKQ